MGGLLLNALSGVLSSDSDPLAPLSIVRVQARRVHRESRARTKGIGSLLTLGAALTLLWLQAPVGLGQETAPQIGHVPPAGFVWGSPVEIRARVPGESTGVNFYYKQPGVEQFQVRALAKAEDGSYVLSFDTAALTEMTFTYYLEVIKGETKILFPAGAPKELLTVMGKGQAAPSIPQDIPTPQAEEAKFQFPVSLAGSTQAKVYSALDTPGADATQTSGNARIAVDYRMGQRYGLSLDSNSAYAQTPPQGVNHLSLSNLKASATKGNHVLRLGDLDLNESEYSIFGLSRRGMEYVYDDQTLYVRGFMVSSQQVKGFEGFGVPTSSVRILGGVAGYKLWNNTVSLKALYLAGKDDPNQGVNVGASPFLGAREGSVAAIVEETHLLQQALNLRFEIAKSSYDGNLTDEQGRATDYAYQLGADFRRGSFNGTAKYKHIGKDFNSIGLQFISNDREGLEANLGFMSGKVSLQGMYMNERDNVDHDPARCITKSQNGQLMGTLTLSTTLVLNAGLRLSGQDTVNSGYRSLLQDSVTHETTAGLVWTPWTSTSLNCTLVDSDIASKNNPASDTRALTVNTALSYRAGQVWTICPTFTWSRSVYSGMDVTCVSINANVMTELLFWPQTMSLAVYGTGNRTEMPGAGPSKLLNLTAALNLQVGNLIKFKTITLSLRGSYNQMTMAGNAIKDTRVYIQGDLAL